MPYFTVFADLLIFSRKTQFFTANLKAVDNIEPRVTKMLPGEICNRGALT